ncbi:type II CAAX endopeptidase family protein [Clostridium sp. CTA-5]
MNFDKKRFNLFTSNAYIQVILKIIKVFLIATLCLLPLVIIGILFNNGKIPSCSIVICLMVGSLLAIKQEFGSLKVVGFTSKNVCKHISYGLALCIIYYLTIIGINLLLGYSIAIKPFFNIGMMVMLSNYIIVGFSEEILFRGYIFKLVYKETHVANKAVIIQAIIFSAIHIVNPTYENLLEFIYALIIGIILGFLVLQQQNLWGAIVFHILFNCVNEILILNKSVYVVLTGFVIVELFLISVYKKNQIHVIKN